MDAPVIGITGYADQSARPPNVSVFALSRTYVETVAAAGGAPVILPPYLELSLLRETFDSIDGLILSGGGDIYPSFFGEKDQGSLWRVDRERDGTEISLAKWALTEGLPVLAICRGLQVLNVASGGTLIQDIPTQVENALSHSSVAGRPVPRIAHSVEVESNTRLATLIGAGTMGVNSAHHQAAKAIGSDLVATARAPDGVVEGLEAPDHAFCIGVQWHPEVMVEQAPTMLRLFQGLIEAAQA